MPLLKCVSIEIQEQIGSCRAHNASASSFASPPSFSPHTACLNTSIGQRRSHRWAPCTYINTWASPHYDRTSFQQIICYPCLIFKLKVLVKHFVAATFWNESGLALIGWIPIWSGSSDAEPVWEGIFQFKWWREQFYPTVKWDIGYRTRMTNDFEKFTWFM